MRVELLRHEAREEGERKRWLRWIWTTYVEQKLESLKEGEKEGYEEVVRDMKRS